MSTPARLTLVLCLIVAAFLAGRLLNGPSVASAPSSSSSVSKEVLYWMCPMHPQYKSDHAGDAPCCGMRMVPVYADGQPGQPAAPLPMGAVQVDAAHQQLIGVRTGEVTRAPFSHRLRLPGRAAVDESRLHRLIASVDGWIRELGPNSAGAFVKQDQVLAAYYVPSLMGAQQAYLFATSAADPFTKSELVRGSQRAPLTLTLQTAIDALRSLGMADLQLEELKRNQVFANQINVYSPITGFVVARDISPGQRFEKGTELYRIADISHLWVITDVFEKDRQFVRPGAVATVRYEGREFQARMSDTLPQFDPQSRTLKTRFELDNAGNILRPNVFVDVELHVNMPPAVIVPSDAVIDSGRSKTVFVDRGNGSFEPRQVETGWRLGDRVQITKGLEPGERIVVSGNFLIDSESRMKFAAQPPPAPQQGGMVKDLVCGMDVDPKAPAALKLQHEGRTYYFCSEQCKKSFEAAPAKYIPGQ